MNGDDVPRRLLRAFGDGLGGFVGALQRAVGPVSQPARALGFDQGPQHAADLGTRSYHYVANPLPDSHSDHLAGPSSTSFGSSGRLVHALGRIGFDFGSESARDKFAGLLEMKAWQLSAPAVADYLARSDPAAASSLVWTLTIEDNPVYAVRPAGPYASLDYRSLIERLLDTRAEGLFGLSGAMSGSERLLTGRTVPTVLVDTLARIEDVAAAVAATDAVLIKGTRRRYQNVGDASMDRARNFVLGDQLEGAVAAARAWMSDPARQGARAQGQTLPVVVAIDDIKVAPSPAYRPWAECYDVEISFFNPQDWYELIYVTRWIVDVSRPRPAQIGDRIEWEVIPR